MTQIVDVVANPPRITFDSIANRLAKIARTEEEQALKPLDTLAVLDAQEWARALGVLGGLSKREQTILVPMLRGLENDEIAEELDLSRRTVKFHVSNILRKLRITHRSKLLRFFF